MSTLIKKTTFEDLYHSFCGVLNHIDRPLTEAKNKNSENVFEGHRNYKTFLQAIERQAIKDASAESNLSESATRERWKVMSLPHPFYTALESGEVSYSRIKPLIVLNFDFEGDKDISASENIMSKILDNTTVIPTKNIRDMAQNELNDAGIWNESDIVIKRIAEQHSIRG